MIDANEDRENQEMEALEEALRGELREPVPLPEGFTARLLERVAVKAETKAPMRWQAIAAVAALVCIAVLGGEEARHSIQRHKAIHTAEQFTTAMQLTQTALHETAGDVDSQLRSSINTLALTEIRKANQ